MVEVFRQGLKTRLVTRRYPAEPEPAPPEYRGQVMLEANRCTGDGACATVCPSQAIRIERPEGGGWTWELSDARCVFCGLCEDACPTGAIALSNEYELAVRNEADLVTLVRFVVPEGDAP